MLRERQWRFVYRMRSSIGMGETMAYKVLVVEDEREKARGIAYLIGKSNPECEPVLLAFDGQEGCRRAEEEQPDIILTDIKMPGMDGLEMIGALRKAGCTAEFVVLSGYAEFGYAKRAMELGVKDFITKPVDEKELGRTLNGLCREIAEQRISRDSMDRIHEDMREYAFREYLAGNPGSRSKVGEYLKQLGILDACSRYTCLVLEGEKKELFAPKEGLIRQEGQFVYAFRISDTQLAAVICAEKLEREEKRTFDWQSLVSGEIRQERFGIGMGSTYGSYEDLPKAYEEALIAVNYRILRGSGTVILFEELCGMENQTELLTRQEIENLKERIDRFDQEGFRIAVRGILRRVQEENRLSLPELQKLSLNIVLEGLHNIPTAQLQMNEYFGRNLFTLKSIEKFKTMEQLENWILNMVGSANELMLQDKVPQKKDIILEAKEYIRQHYNRNITLQDLAERFYLNPYYFSQLFKKKAGVTYQNYLTGYRIDRARKLLEETDLHICEVCRLVGYSDVNHFNQLFERETGCKPSAYRQQKRQKTF